MLPTVEILKHGASSFSCDSYSRIRPSGWVVVYLASVARSESVLDNVEADKGFQSRMILSLGGVEKG